MGHEPIQFGTRGKGENRASSGPGQAGEDVRPRHLELKRDRALVVHWSDGRVSIYPIAYLRRMSPSADARALREEMKTNPLTVLPTGKAGAGGEPLVAEGAELVGNYAIRIRFSDGHDTGIYSWAYLREIAPPPAQPPGGGSPAEGATEGGEASPPAATGGDPDASVRP